MVLSKEKEQEYIKKVSKDGFYLKRLKKNQTNAICLAAVKQNPWAFQYAVSQTEEICLMVVKRDGELLRYVKNQTESICLEAVKQNGYALKHVKEQVEEVCLGALFSGRQDFEFNYTYRHISSPTDEMQIIKSTVMKNGDLKSYRQIRYRLANKEIILTDSPYHVLERLYSY